jgi:hypothetical protein
MKCSERSYRGRREERARERENQGMERKQGPVILFSPCLGGWK